MSSNLDPQPFRDLSYGLYIVTSIDGERMNGQMVNTAIQVTSEPPRVAVIINKKNLTHEFISKSKVFAVAVLEEETPMTFIGPFGFRTGRDIDKFVDVPFEKGVTGCPLITKHTLSVLEARVIDQVDLGTHSIFVGDCVNTKAIKSGRPLTYRYYHEVLKAKTPANAPSFIASK